MTRSNDQSMPEIIGVSLQNVNVERGNLTVGDITINYITKAAERPPLWVGVPGLPTHFVGRDDLLDNLVNRLLQDGAPSVAIHGLPGVGKSTVAVMIAHHKRLLAHFSDGVLWAGLGVNADLPSILNHWAKALEIDITELRTDAEKAQAIRDAIGHKRLLLVIDDAWQSDPALALRCGGDNCSYLLTTRDKTVARKFTSAEQTVEIPVLAEESARFLLSILAPEAWAANAIATAALADAVGRLPLALELLGGYLAAPENTAFAELINESLEEMADPERRLELASRRLGDLGGEIVTLQATIALSLESLPPPALSGFYALGAFAPKPAKFDRMAAQTVTEANLRILALLSARNLLEIDSGESLLLHQTLADVARTGTPAKTITRHREHYLALVNANKEDWQAIQSFYPQVQWAWRHIQQTDQMAVEFVNALFVYQSRRGIWSDLFAWLDLALQESQQNGDAKQQSYILNNYGLAYTALGQNKKALEFYTQALPLSHQVGDKSNEARTLNNIGAIHRNQGDMQQALAYYSQSLLLIHQVKDIASEAATLTNIGAVYDALGKKQQALAAHNQAVPLFRQIGDRFGEARTLNNIGHLYDTLGNKQVALDLYILALSLSEQIGDKSGQAVTLNNIGLIYYALGERQKALKTYTQALSLFQEVDDKSGEGTLLNNFGQVYDALGEKQEALAYYVQALRLVRQVGNKFGEAGILNNIGLLHFTLGEHQQALAYYAQALPLIRQAEDKAGEARTLINIGLVYNILREQGKALGYFEQSLLLFRQADDRNGEGTALNNIGMIYSELGQKQKALDYYEQSLPLTRQMEDRKGEATALYNIGTVYEELRENEKALKHFEQVLRLDRELGDRNSEANTLIKLATIHGEKRDFEETASLLELTIRIYSDIEMAQSEAYTRFILALILANRLGKVDEAIAHLEEAIALLIRFSLPQDAVGQTLADYNNILAQLRGTQAIWSLLGRTQ